MRIRFKSPDPRSGTVVEMDSQRAQHFVDEGNADRLDDNVPQPPADKPEESLITGTAEDVVERIAGVSDLDQLKAAQAAENEGKRRKTVLTALATAIRNAEKKAD